MAQTPPIAKMLRAGLRVGAGTDATRVANYNPWNSIYWLVTGKPARSIFAMGGVCATAARP